MSSWVTLFWYKSYPDLTFSNFQFSFSKWNKNAKNNAVLGRQAQDISSQVLWFVVSSTVFFSDLLRFSWPRFWALTFVGIFQRIQFAFRQNNNTLSCWTSALSVPTLTYIIYRNHKCIWNQRVYNKYILLLSKQSSSQTGTCYWESVPYPRALPSLWKEVL